MILDLFAGPGGWDLGLEMCGRRDVVGIEWDDDACATRRAVGLPTIRADVAAWPERLMPRAEGLIASPPCQAFSTAGKRKGHLDADRLLAFADRWARDGWSSPGEGWADVRTPLILEPMRYIDVIEPTWVAMEQVAPALPFFEAMLPGLDKRGYSASVAVLQAEAYGVPQTRKRCFLIAHRGREVVMPVPTHSRYHPRSPERLDPGVLPWVSMAEALGWGYDARPSPTCTGGGAATGGAEPFGHGARKALQAWMLGERNGQWTLHTNRDQRPDGSRQTSTGDRPAPTLTAKSGGQWQWHGPATTVAGDPRLSGPGRNDPEVSGSQYGPSSVKLSVEEALVLQSFPVDYPVQGTKTARFRQIGDAVPPLLAAAVLGVLL